MADSTYNIRQQGPGVRADIDPVTGVVTPKVITIPAQPDSVVNQPVAQVTQARELVVTAAVFLDTLDQLKRIAALLEVIAGVEISIDDVTNIEV